MEIKQRTRWKKVSKDGYQVVENFLKARESLCVNASARFLSMQNMAEQDKRSHIWYIPCPEESISSLLIHSRYSLFPVFGENQGASCPAFLRRFFKVPVHSIQGLRKDVENLETLMQIHGYFATERIDYELMNIDAEPISGTLRSGPPGLKIRSPMPDDKEQLFALQSAYEKEEVLPKSAVFNPASCLYRLENILSSERILVAELDGKVVGKINTNAESFTRYQIGGVYVRPDYRNLGIGSKMIAVFSSSILTLGKGITLFSKIENKAARKAYIKAGFDVLAYYRICYF